MIHGFDAAIRGMIPGEEKTVILTPEEAYGERNESLVQLISIQEANTILKTFDPVHVSVSIIPEIATPVIEYLPPGEKTQRYRFSNITNESVTVDMNKPLAGKDLQFRIQLEAAGT